MKRFKLTASQSQIVEAVQKESMGKIWVVGGAVRDALMDKVPKDIDFATDLTPTSVEHLVVRFGFCCIPDQKAKDHGIIRVVDKDTGEFIDIATLRRDTDCDGRYAKVEFTQDLKEDLSRRDLTINAMAAVIDTDGYILQVFDYFDGTKDVEEKRVKFVGNPCHRIKEDALRMIRACRFLALGDDWKLETSDFWAIHDMNKYNPELFDGISKERIRDEFIKALKYDKPSNFIRCLHDSKLLLRICRPLADAWGVEQNEYHDEEVFTHLLAALDAMCELSPSHLLRLAALTHDIGKPPTRSVADDGKVHFFRHEVEGASIIYNWMREYKFSTKQTEYVSKLVRHHQWRFEANSKDKTIRKWLQKVGPDCWRDLITLRMADRKGNFAKKHKPMMTSHMHDLVQKVEKILEAGDAIFREDLAIDGNDIKECGVPPGPVYKEIFANMLGIVIQDPERNTKDWLTNYIKKNYVKE